MHEQGNPADSSVPSQERVESQLRKLINARGTYKCSYCLTIALLETFP